MIRASRYDISRHLPVFQSQPASAELRYSVGSAHVTVSPAQLRSIMREGVFLVSCKFLVKGEASPRHFDALSLARSPSRQLRARRRAFIYINISKPHRDRSSRFQLCSIHLFVASSTANTPALSALSRISTLPVKTLLSLPLLTLTATKTKVRSKASNTFTP